MNDFKDILKENIFKYRLQLFILLVFYTLLYSLGVVGNVSSVEFMGIDEKSIIDSINSLTSRSFYNMNSTYHSQYYGWTYFSLNFFVVGFLKIFGLSEGLGVNLAVRSLHFIIGMSLSVAFFILIEKIVDKRWLALLLSLFFITDPIVSHFINEIHPESLGVLLQIVALLIMYDIYVKQEIETKKSIYAVVFLSLSALCKQAFIVANFFVALGFFILYYSQKRNLTSEGSVSSMAKVIKMALITFFSVFFLIHPFAFLQPHKFLHAQSSISSEHAGRLFSEVFPLWVDTLSNSPLVVLNLALIFALPLLFRISKPLFISVIFSNVVGFIFIFKARLWIAEAYLMPVYLFVFLNVFYSLYKLTSARSGLVGYLIKITIVSFIFVNMAENFSYSMYTQQSRYFKDGLRTKDQAWDYLSKLDQTQKIAYSPNIAMPDELKRVGCHAWQGCSDFESLKKYAPDLIVISESYPYFSASEYLSFIKKFGYREINSFSREEVARTSCHRSQFDESSAYILSYSYRINTTVNCLKSYREMLDDHNENRIIAGEVITVYGK